MCRRKRFFNFRKKWMELGIDALLERRPQRGPSRQPKLDGKAEAKLIAVSCGPAPQGRARWTLRLLADKVVELQIASSISHETIRQTLKKHRKARNKSGTGTAAPTVSSCLHG